MGINGGGSARSASGYNFLNFHRICITHACIPYACIYENIYHIRRPLGVRWREEKCCAPFRETSVACSTEPRGPLTYVDVTLCCDPVHPHVTPLEAET